jgi:hypothetical protein
MWNSEGMALCCKWNAVMEWVLCCAWKLGAARDHNLALLLG